MKISRRSIAAGAGLLFMILGLWQGAASAQAPATSQSPGISITPGRLDLKVSPTEPAQAVTVTIANNYDYEVSLSAEFQKIDNKSSRILPSGPLKQPLASALRVSQNLITIPARSSSQLTVQADRIATLRPGGNYAMLVLTQQNGSAATGQASYRAALSLSIFLINNENIHERFVVTGIRHDGWLFNLPSAVTLDFRNDGNVHTVPRAYAELTGRHGRVLASGTANQEALPLLPAKQATYPAQLTAESHTWLPQSVTLALTYSPDPAGNPKTEIFHFWYVPPLYPAVSVVLVTLVVWLAWRRLRRRSRQTASSPGNNDQTEQHETTDTDQSRPSAHEVKPQAPEPEGESAPVVEETTTSTEEETEPSTDEPETPLPDPKDTPEVEVPPAVEVTPADEPLPKKKTSKPKRKSKHIVVAEADDRTT